MRNIDNREKKKEKIRENSYPIMLLPADHLNGALLQHRRLYQLA